MERTHSQLRTWLTDWLCGNSTNSFTNFNNVTSSHVTTVVVYADTVFRVASKGWANVNSRNAGFNNGLSLVFVDHFVVGNDNFTSRWVNNGLLCVTSQNTLIQWLNDFVTVHDGWNIQTTISTTVKLTNDNVLRNVNQTTSHVTWVGRLQGRISHTLTSTVSWEEHFQNWQSFTEVGNDRQLHDTSVRRSHQTTHTGQLRKVRNVTTSSWIWHHKDVVIRFEVLNQLWRDVILRLVPDGNNTLITLIVSNQSTTELLRNSSDLLVSFFDDSWLFLQVSNVGHTNRQTRLSWLIVTQVLHTVQ